MTIALQRVGRAAERAGESGDSPASSSRRRSPAHGSGRPTRSCGSRRSDWPVDGAFSVRMASADCSPVRSSSRSTASRSRARRSRRASPTASSIRIPQPEPEEARRDGDVQPPRGHRAVRVARLARRREGRGVSRPDAGQPPLHGVYDKFKLAAFIHSAALAMPRDDTPMTVNVDKGVRAARGGNETRDRLAAGRHDPGPHQPALLRRAHDRRRQRALRARADSAARQLVAGGRTRVRRQGHGAAAAGAPSAAAEGGPAAVPLDERERDRRRHLSTSSPAGDAQLRAVGRRRQHVARLQVSRAGRPLPARDREGRRAGHRRIRLGQAVRRDRQGRAVSAGADVPRPGRAAVAVRRSQGRLPRARRRQGRGRDRPRAAEPAAASRAADVGLLAAATCTAASKTSWSSGSSPRATTRGRPPGKPTYDSIDVGQYLEANGAVAARLCSCCTSGSTAQTDRGRRQVVRTRA